MSGKDLVPAGTADLVRGNVDTCIALVLDRSGSMDKVRDAAITGLNAYIADQQGEPGNAVMSVVLFDDKYEFPYKGVPIGQVKPFDHSTYVPRERTALYDAVGFTIRSIREQLEGMPRDRRPQVIVVVLTDGLNNASNTFTHPEQIKELVEVERRNGWVFMFLSSGGYATEVGKSMGIPEGSIKEFAKDDPGAVKDTFTAASQATSYTRTTGRPADLREMARKVSGKPPTDTGKKS